MLNYDFFSHTIPEKSFDMTADYLDLSIYHRNGGTTLHSVVPQKDVILLACE